MYVFDLWFADRRAAIARAEVTAVPVWAELRAELEAKHPGHQSIIDEVLAAAFEDAVRKTTHNIHPLVILGLRKRHTN